MLALVGLQDPQAPKSILLGEARSDLEYFGSNITPTMLVDSAHLVAVVRPRLFAIPYAT